MLSFSLTKKKQKVKTKRSAAHKANLLRVLSGLRSVFKLRWLRKPGAGVHERSELECRQAKQGKPCAPVGTKVGVRGGFLQYFFAAEKSIIKKSD